MTANAREEAEKVIKYLRLPVTGNMREVYINVVEQALKRYAFEKVKEAALDRENLKELRKKGSCL